MRLLLASLLLVASVARADGAVARQRLRVSLFGESVGEVRLTLSARGAERTLTYRSDVTVVRDTVRTRQQGFIEATFEDATGRLVSAQARRCSGPEADAHATNCTKPTARGRGARVPSLAAELLLARGGAGPERCIDVVDEESGNEGVACAVVTIDDSGTRTLDGHKLGVAFRARVDRHGLLSSLELPAQGARFEIADGEIERSDADLYADPIPSAGNVPRALRAGSLRARLLASPEALARLPEDLASLAGHARVERPGDAVIIETRRITLPKGRASRRIVDHAALLVAQARGGHVDCQGATRWFLAEAKKRGWKAKPAVGIAWVDGRFAFHAWAVIETPEGLVPVDPLLAQVPADPAHLQLAAPGSETGALLVAFRGGLAIEVE